MTTLQKLPLVKDPRDHRIAACIPYYRCKRYLRRAVECLLAQTHRDITVVVVNDGDPEPPWPLLADFQDPRLVRFNLRNNHGPYFATAVVLNATSAPFFLIQDADDWSSPGRAACLLGQLERDGSDFAVSAQLHYTETDSGSSVSDLKWSSVSSNGSGQKWCVLRTKLTPDFVYRAPHHGLFRTDSVRRAGGYYGGFRISYDAMLTNLILMIGRISHVPQPLYYRQVWPESLTQSPVTGMRSRTRQEAEHSIAALYKRCFNLYLDYLAGRIDSSRFAAAIRACVWNNVSASDARQLAIETERLKQLLHAQAWNG
jgi:hypothetical protein